MSKTTIEWTQETWNPTVGCDQVSPGCANCYAKTLHDKRHKAALDGARLAAQYLQPFETLQLMEARLEAPIRRVKPTTYFVNSVSDLFHEAVPDAFIDQVFVVMALAPRHTFQILTKRADRMRAYFESFKSGAAVTRAYHACEWASTLVGYEAAVGPRVERIPMGLPNVWLGVSVENQHFADERIPLLLQTPAAIRFISAEPLLGPVDLETVPLPSPGAEHYGLRGVAQPASEKDAEPDDWKYWTRRDSRLDWVIVGGESGAGARPFNVVWARSLVEQCKTAGVACFMKQLGSMPYDGTTSEPTGRFRTNPETGRRQFEAMVDYWKLRDRKGGDPAEWPEDLRVRQFPAAVAQ